MTANLDRARRLVWFGLAAAPAAWVLQHVAGFGLAQVRCPDTGPAGVYDLDASTLAVTGVFVAVAIAGEAAAILAWRWTRDAGEELPAARVHFLAVVGLTIGPLYLAIMLMSGLGAAFLTPCVQS